jgi:glycosyltransferase involved in cell wall biosynthesis
VTTSVRPLRIALLCESFGALGGVAQIVEDLAIQFASAGNQVAIISNAHQGQMMIRRQHPSLEHVWVGLPRDKPFSLRHPERLLRQAIAPDLVAFLQQWRPDVINIHGGLRDRFTAVLRACKPAGIPIVQSFHLVPEPPGEDPHSRRMKAFCTAALRAAAAITFPSQAVKQAFVQFWPEAERARIIRGGVNLKEAERADPLIRSKPYIFSASRLDLNHKAVDAVIDGFRLIATEYPEFELLIAGDGPQRATIKQMVRASGLGARIYLLPALPHHELWSFYKAASIFIMLSRMAEGLPLVFFEAMACRVPVIATNNGGTPEIIAHNRTGLLIDSLEPDEVAVALKSLLADPERRKQMGQEGYWSVKAFDWQTVANQYVHLYRGLLFSQRGT